MKKKYFFAQIIFIFLIIFFCSSCTTNEPQGSTNGGKPEEKIEYYVKYESEVYIPISRYIPINIIFETEDGSQELQVPRVWEGVFGPFNKLTTLYLSSKTTGFNENSCHCRGRISICKNNQPYILKVDESFKGTSYSISYKVTAEDLK